MNFFSYLFAIAAGLANPVQAGANAQLNTSLANPVWAALIVYASGLAGMLLVQAVVRQAWPGARVGEVPWWAWLGGASLVTSVALDRFGWVGFQVHPASWPRLAGTGLMVAGIWLIAKF